MQKPLFQYISCYCLSKGQDMAFIFLYISIHLMLLFIGCVHDGKRWKMGISIHLMLLFIRSDAGNELCVRIISIHLMLLFIEYLAKGRFRNLHFNTSHVTVYHEKPKRKPLTGIFQYISCYCLSETPLFCQNSM